ncbi:MAG: hypothetical protein ACYDGR_01145 [Candidatus Dormibacteria bacterium]
MHQSTIVLIAVVVVAVVIVLMALARRSGRGRLSLTVLPDAEVERYVQEMEAVVSTFVDEPQQAAARARGLVEEVMRRMGFPDRIEREQRVKDLAGHDREAARHLASADAGLRQRAEDTEELRKVVQAYREVLHRILGHHRQPPGADPEVAS